jgi:hypothetical protein
MFRMSRNSTKAAAVPSDLELMLHADGELEGDRLDEVEGYLAGLAEGSPARRKLSALSLASGIVREQALESAAGADSLADAVMAQIASEKAQSAASKPADVVPLRAASAKAGGKPEGKPANDNARGVYALAAIALAAAAALVFWGRTAQGPEVASNPPGATAPAWTAAPEPTPSPEPAAVAEPAPSEEHGVEVASINFGARMGSIFYVPSGTSASNATTTVVWLNDDAAGEK